MKANRFIAPIILFVAIFSQTLYAQTETVKKRPKIGLVLSGGGARGIAHIGVLQWFEENRIPIDYIAGTSMGGIVGGMYAAGKTPAEMRQIVEGVDWEDALRAAPAYDELSFRRKQDRRANQTLIEFGIKNGIGIPSGLNSGHKAGLIFDRVTLPYDNVKNFDDLVVPFRAVATDMVKGEAVIMKNGSLSTAMLATMAIPGVFSPVERDGKILADGGLVNNIPTNVVKEMGADIIIAVDIGTPLGDKKSLESIGGVLSQSIGIALIGNDRRNLALADIIIAPDLGKYTLFDFEAAQTIYELGYEGTQAKSIVLKNLALGETAWTQYLAEKNARRKNEVGVPENIAVTGEKLKPVNEEDIKQKLETHVGKAIEPQKIEKDLNKIRGEGRLESLGYGVERRDGKNTLLIKAEEKTTGTTTLTPDVVVEIAGTDDVFTTLGGRLTFFDIGGYRSELRTDLKFGSEMLLASELYKPLGRNGFFVAPHAFYDSKIRSVYENNRRVADYRVRRFGIGLDAGYTYRKSEVRFGFEVNRLDGLLRVGNPDLPAYKGNESRVFARYEFDNTDSAFIPTKGFRFDTEARYFLASPGAEKGFSQAETEFSIFDKLGKKGVVYLNAAGGTTFLNDASPFQTFRLGGTGRLSAFSRNEFSGNNFIFARAGYLREIYTLPSIIGGRVNLFGAVESGGAFNRFRAGDYYNALTGGIIVVTSLGPVTLGGSLGERGRGKIYFSLGKVF